MRMLGESGRALGVGVGVGAGALLAWWAWRRHALPDTPTQWEEVGEVSELVIYPLKSGRGVKVKQAEATPYGLAQGLLQDRSFLAVDASGKFITGRQAPKLPTVILTLEGNRVTLQNKEKEQLEFELDAVVTSGKVTDAVVFNANVRGHDCGGAAAAWLSQVLYGGEQEVRLLFCGDLTRDRIAREPIFYTFPQYKKSDKVLFADTCAYMMSTEASLADLNTRLERPVNLDWFRSNIVVRGTSAYDEDDWAFVKIGDVVLRRLKPCDRCVFTFVDPEKGEKCSDQEPLTTLKRYRQGQVKGSEALQKTWAIKPVFGSHLGINTCGRVQVGDKVLVGRASSNPKWQY